MLSTVDAVTFRCREGQLQVLAIRRSKAPYEGAWALPGGFVREMQDLSKGWTEPVDPNIDSAMRRVLREKTGYRPDYIEQVGFEGSATRDPRGWSQTNFYLALLNDDSERVDVEGELTWIDAFSLVGDAAKDNPLAFDHNTLVERALSKLDWLMRTSNVGVHLVNRQFTATDYRVVHETVLKTSFSSRTTFNKRLDNANIAEVVGTREPKGRGKAANLYAKHDTLPVRLFDRVLEGAG